MVSYRGILTLIVALTMTSVIEAQAIAPPGAPVIGTELGKPGEVFLRQTPFTRQVEVKWKGIEGADHYVVEIYGHRNNMVIRQRVPLSEILVNLKPGEYTVRVAGLSRLGAQGLWSDRAPLTVTPRNRLTPDKVRERVDILSEIKQNIEEESGAGASEALGIGPSEIFGFGAEYGIPTIDFAPFEPFWGGTIFFRYHRLFLDNLKPEIRLSFLYGLTSDPAIEALTVMRFIFHINYSIPLFNHTFFIVPNIGFGPTLVSLSSVYIGENYFPPALSAGIELSYEPVSTFRIYISYDFVHIFLQETMQFSLPSVGFILKF